jgi:hypothetical protein
MSAIFKMAAKKGALDKFMVHRKKERRKRRRIIIIRNRANTISLQTLFGRLNKFKHSFAKFFK